MTLSDRELPPVVPGRINSIPSENVVMIAMDDWDLIQAAVTAARQHGLLESEDRLRLLAMRIVEYA